MCGWSEKSILRAFARTRAKKLWKIIQRFIFYIWKTYLLAFSNSAELTMRRIIVSSSTKRYWFCKVSQKWNFCSSKCSFLLTRNSLSWHAKLSLRLIVTNSKQTVYIVIYSRYFFSIFFLSRLPKSCLSLKLCKFVTQLGLDRDFLIDGRCISTFFFENF